MPEEPRSLLPVGTEEVPASANLVLPLFTYGTLLDEVFMKRLLQHPVRSEAARLTGFRVARLAGLDWPVIQPSPGESVPGRLYRGIGLEDFRRLDAYEGVYEQLYRRVVVSVVAECRRSNDGNGADMSESAFVYLPSERTLERHGGIV